MDLLVGVMPLILWIKLDTAAEATPLKSASVAARFTPHEDTSMGFTCGLTGCGGTPAARAVAVKVGAVVGFRAAAE